MFKNKKILLTLIILFSFVSFSFVSQAGTLENGMGWLWGGTDDGVGNNTGSGWISLNNTTSGGATNYGVSIPMADGSLSGYAWSENLGWISFNAANIVGCPDGNCVAQRLGNKVVGWARIIGISEAGLNAGGWSGWIRLSGTSYGASIDPVTNKFLGYAWSDELGWIDFSRAAINIPKTITASVLANPALVADSATPVSIAASITGGTASGIDIKYELDCTNDGTIEKTYTSVTGESAYTFNNACNYSTSSYVAVRITREGAITTPTAPVIFGCVDSVCDTSSYKCQSQIKSSGQCNSNCNEATNCQKPRDLNWKEVSPNN